MRLVWLLTAFLAACAPQGACFNNCNYAQKAPFQSSPLWGQSDTRSGEEPLGDVNADDIP